MDKKLLIEAILMRKGNLRALVFSNYKKVRLTFQSGNLVSFTEYQRQSIRLKMEQLITYFVSIKIRIEWALEFTKRKNIF
jgi:hypothetical protein